jgi:uncharacterized membrane protein
MSASSSVFGKIFNKKNDEKRDSTIFYNFLLMISVFIGWGILYIIDFSFDANVLWYSILFAICYTACNLGIINALKYGPAMLTSLFISLSLILTTLWGFVFWDAKVTLPVIIGLLLVACAIVLCLYTKGKDDKSVSWKWLLYVALAFFGNAGCSIVQRTQQVQHNGQHGNMLMLFAIGFCALAYLIIYLKSNREDTPTMLKTSWWLPVCAGICNVILNVFVMLMAVTDLSPSLIYPVIGVGGLAVVTIFSLLVFKEKMRWWQWVGVAVGAVAVILLSI